MEHRRGATECIIPQQTQILYPNTWTIARRYKRASMCVATKRPQHPTNEKWPHANCVVPTLVGRSRCPSLHPRIRQTSKESYPNGTPPIDATRIMLVNPSRLGSALETPNAGRARRTLSHVPSLQECPTLLHKTPDTGEIPSDKS